MLELNAWKKWGKKARSALTHKCFSLLDCYWTFPLPSENMQSWFLQCSSIRVTKEMSLWPGSSITPPSMCACPTGLLCGPGWAMQALGQLCLLPGLWSCQKSHAWPVLLVLPAKMAAWFKKICPTSKSGQREQEMRLHVLFLLCFTLCSWLLFCYCLTPQHVSCTRFTQQPNPQLLQLMLWCHLYLFSG